MSERRPSFDMPRDEPSYDDKQLGAVRTKCIVCLRTFDMTVTHAHICSACQQQRWEGLPDDAA